MDKSSLIRKFNKQSSIYRENARKQTLGVWRKKLLEDVHGDVLEIAVGAGANLSFYAKDSVDLTAVDFSPMMLQHARQLADELQFKVNFIESDIETLDFPDHSFDCIVSTLSLCGYNDPVSVLNKMNRWSRPGGRIYLLEHGLSSYRLIQYTQQVINPIARKFSGCHWNRNMDDILHSSDLEVEKTEYYWNGIIHLIWARAT